jgi:inorganic pyrophosphatase
MIDGNEADDKIVAVLENDLARGALRELADCPKMWGHHTHFSQRQ